jgi:hypothetical protein
MEDTLSWNYYVLEWNWHALLLAGLPGWEKVDDDPPSIFLEFIRGRGISKSHKIASEWDDLAKHDFYYRDWTSDTIPVVREGEKYWSTFSFQRRSEAERFQKKYGGIANWVPGWAEHLDSIFRRRDV